jgi:hypothetical protein
MSLPLATVAVPTLLQEEKRLTTAHIILSAREPAACPKCSHSFPIAEGLSRQAIERYAEDFEQALARRTRDIEAQVAAEAKRRAERESARHLESLKAELADQQAACAAASARLAELRAGELELRRQLRESDEQRRGQEVEYQRRLDAERKRIEERAHGQASEEFARREAQYKAQLESLRREADDMRRKAGQGSQQTQGEALELALEAMLRAAFPFDEIVPVPKGVNGADLLQRVRSSSGQTCGTIVWETKETKNWQPAWIGKLRDDQQAVGAEVAVLVTAAMPRDAREPFIRESDVWVARLDAARPLAEALRTTLLELHKLRQANTGRHEKMEVLYRFVHSPQFAQRMQAIGQAFAAMREELEAEKAAMTRIWKKREAQIVRVSGGLMNVIGELQGLAEDALPELDAVGVLPAPDDAQEGIVAARAVA